MSEENHEHLQASQLQQQQQQQQTARLSISSNDNIKSIGSSTYTSAESSPSVSIGCNGNSSSSLNGDNLLRYCVGMGNINDDTCSTTLESMLTASSSFSTMHREASGSGLFSLDNNNEEKIKHEISAAIRDNETAQTSSSSSPHFSNHNSNSESKLIGEVNVTHPPLDCLLLRHRSLASEDSSPVNTSRAPAPTPTSLFASPSDKFISSEELISLPHQQPASNLPFVSQIKKEMSESALAKFNLKDDEAQSTQSTADNVKQIISKTITSSISEFKLSSDGSNKENTGQQSQPTPTKSTSIFASIFEKMLSKGSSPSSPKNSPISQLKTSPSSKEQPPSSPNVDEKASKPQSKGEILEKSLSSAVSSSASSSSPNPDCSPYKLLINEVNPISHQTKLTLSSNGSPINEAATIFDGAHQLDTSINTTNDKSSSSSEKIIESLASLNHKEHEKADPILSALVETVKINESPSKIAVGSGSSHQVSSSSLQSSTLVNASNNQSSFTVPNITVPSTSQEFCMNLNFNLAAAAATTAGAPVAVLSSQQPQVKPSTASDDHKRFTLNASTSSIHNDLKLIVEEDKQKAVAAAANGKSQSPKKESSAESNEKKEQKSKVKSNSHNKHEKHHHRHQLEQGKIENVNTIKTQNMQLTSSADTTNSSNNSSNISSNNINSSSSSIGNTSHKSDKQSKQTHHKATQLKQERLAKPKFRYSKVKIITLT
jgi:trimeric autotransporter adhesin